MLPPIKWKLVSDGGAINVNNGAEIRAASTSRKSSNINLYASSGILIQDGSVIDASAVQDSELAGGNIELYVSVLDAQLVAESGSIITALGDNDSNNGELIAGIRVDTGDTSTDNLSNRLSILSTGDFSNYIISPFVSNTQSGNQISQSDIDNAFTSLAAYVDRNEQSLSNALTIGELNYQLGLEFQATQLSTADEINLSGLRYDDNGITLVLRSSGTLNVDHSITDGFADDLLLDETSSDIILVAGADLLSSDFASMNNLGTSSLELNQDVVTGTGDISAYADGDINLNANLFTAGRNAGYGSVVLGLDFLFGGIQNGRDGGDINITANGDFFTENKDQLVTQWLFRYGAEDIGRTVEFPTAWGIRYDLFDQGVAALGGGNVNIDVAGHATGLNVSIPTIALHQGDFGGFDGRITYTDDSFEILGGGDLHAKIGGQLTNAAIFIDSGVANLDIGQGIGGQNQPGEGLLVSLGDAQINIDARDSIFIDGIISPYLLPISESQDINFPGLPTLIETYFTTFTDDTSVAFSSQLGDVFYETNVEEEFYETGLFINTSGGPVSTVFEYLPGDIDLKALGGDLIFSDDFIVSASPDGNFDLIAYGAIRTNEQENIFIGSSDLSPLSQPSITNKIGAINALDTNLNIEGAGAAFHATTPVHINDDESSKITALTGDLSAQGGSLRIVTAEATDIYAGGDLTSIILSIQNNKPSDVSSIQVGGDIAFPNIRRDSNGELANDSSRITISGPGVLQVISGGDINLGGSNGILTTGNLTSPFSTRSKC